MALFDLHHPWVFAFGVLGNLVSIFVYLSPLPTFFRIYREKSTMGYESLPYVVALFSAMLWMYYALLKHAFLLISINSLGCVIQTLYILFYFHYASKQAKKYTAKLVGVLNVGLFCAIFVVTNFGLHEVAVRIMVVGWICVAFSVCVFAAPLGIVVKVVRTRNAEFMPLALSVTLTLSAVVWFGYGLFEKDICVTVPNIMGFLLGVLQMLLYGIYRKQPKAQLEVDHEKKVVAAAAAAAHDHQQHVIVNIGILGGSSEVHPVDSSSDQTSSISCDDVINSIAADDHDEDETNKKLGSTNCSTSTDSTEEEEEEEVIGSDHNNTMIMIRMEEEDDDNNNVVSGHPAEYLGTHADDDDERRGGGPCNQKAHNEVLHLDSLPVPQLVCPAA